MIPDYEDDARRIAGVMADMLKVDDASVKGTDNVMCGGEGTLGDESRYCDECGYEITDDLYAKKCAQCVEEGGL